LTAATDCGDLIAPRLNHMESSALATHVAWAAFALAFVFGAVANRSGFCAMGAVSDVVNIGSWTRMRMWLFAIAVAMLGAQGLHLAGVVNLSKSIYVTPSFAWLSYAVGGLLFGVGMTLASGCGSKTLVRIGGGSLKAVVVLAFLAISSYMTLKGLFAIWRAAALDSSAIALTSQQDLPTLAAAATGFDAAMLRIVLTGAVSLGLIVFAFASREFRAFDNWFAPLAIGLTIVGGWYVSGKLGYIAEDPNTLQEAFVATNSGKLESFSFVAPAGYALELLMLWTDQSRIVTFGIAGVLGMAAGSFAYALASGTFRVEGFRESGDLANHIAGAILMGFGGVTALGCTIGQGITGVSTLALGSIVTFFAIVAGAAATMKFQYWRLRQMD
jgi:uncharacterized membrane protein YedE/YeeE